MRNGREERREMDERGDTYDQENEYFRGEDWKEG